MRYRVTWVRPSDRKTISVDVCDRCNAASRSLICVLNLILLRTESLVSAIPVRSANNCVPRWKREASDRTSGSASKVFTCSSSSARTEAFTRRTIGSVSELSSASILSYISSACCHCSSDSHCRARCNCCMLLKLERRVLSWANAGSIPGRLGLIAEAFVKACSAPANWFSSRACQPRLICVINSRSSFFSCVWESARFALMFSLSIASIRW